MNAVRFVDISRSEVLKSRRHVLIPFFLVLTLSAAFGRAETVFAQACPARPPGHVVVNMTGLQTECPTAGLCVDGETITFRVRDGDYRLQDCDTITINFGDGTSQTGKKGTEFRHIYRVETFTLFWVSVTVSNDLGSWSSFTSNGYRAAVTKQLTGCPLLPPNGMSGFRWNGGCGSSGRPCRAGEEFFVQALYGNSHLNEACDLYVWDFGDGSVITVPAVDPVTNTPGGLVRHTFLSQGTFTVKVTITNSYGSFTQDRTFVVDANSTCIPPEISEQPAARTVITAGDPVSLSVRVKGTTPINLTWYEGASRSIAVLIGNGPTITVSPTRTEHYWVRISNQCGTIDSDWAQVVVAPSRRRAVRR